MATFTNWVGNQSCSPAQIVAPASEAEVQAAVPRRPAGALRGGRALVHAGAPHRRHAADHGRPAWRAPRRRRPPARATALPGHHRRRARPAAVGRRPRARATRATSTRRASPARSAPCTHGSGLELQSFSASLRRARLVIASGDVLEIGPDDPRLPAVQTSVGMLGVMTEVEIAGGAGAPPRRADRALALTPRRSAGSTSWPARTGTTRSSTSRPRPRPRCTTSTTPPGAQRRRHLLREDLRRGRRRRARLRRRRAAASAAPTGSTRPCSSRTSTSSSTSCRIERGRRGARGDARADAGAAAAVDLPDGGAHGRARGRVAVALLRPRQPRDLRVRPARHRLRALPARRARAARPVRRAGALGQDPLPDARTSCTSGTRGRPTSSRCGASSTRTACS